MKKIAFVTDSTADIPVELVEQHAIEVIPAIVNMRGKSYTDGVDISRQEFYTLLPVLDPPPTTSSPSVGSFQERYEKLLRNGASFILSIHPAKTLSGIFNAARLAAQDFGERIRVIDSGQLSLGTGFQVLLGTEAAEQGAPFEEVCALVDNISKRVRVVALLSTMEYVRRSGRVSWTKGMIGSLLHIRPLMECRFGNIFRLGQARTHAQGIRRLTEALDSWGKLERLAVLHTNAESAARQLLEQVKSKVSIAPIVVNVTTTIGTHVGPDGLGFATVPIE